MISRQLPAKPSRPHHRQNPALSSDQQAPWAEPQATKTIFRKEHRTQRQAANCTKKPGRKVSLAFNFSGSRLLVEPFDIPLFANVQRGIDEHFKKRQAGALVDLPGVVTVLERQKSQASIVQSDHTTTQQ